MATTAKVNNESKGTSHVGCIVSVMFSESRELTDYVETKKLQDSAYVGTKLSYCTVYGKCIRDDLYEMIVACSIDESLSFNEIPEMVNYAVSIPKGSIITIIDLLDYGREEGTEQDQ